MEFLRERVYTSLNADELRAGDKVIVAETLMGLRENVENNAPVCTIKEILGEDFAERFNVDIDWNSHLAYLVERKENCANCGEGEWDDEHKEILCNPCACGLPNHVFRNQEVNVCEYWKPKTEPRAEKKCDTCKYKDCGFKDIMGDKGCEEYEAEKHYRPFANTDELIKVWEKKVPCNGYRPRGTRPLIWVHRDDTHEECLIVTFDNDSVYLGHRSVSLHELWEHFTFLDGSVCGVEE